MNQRESDDNEIKRYTIAFKGHLNKIRETSMGFFMD